MMPSTAAPVSKLRAWFLGEGEGRLLLEALIQDLGLSTMSTCRALENALARGMSEALGCPAGAVPLEELSRFSKDAAVHHYLRLIEEVR